MVDALAHAVLCQAPRAAIATLDSALHLGHVTEAGLAEVFRRFRRSMRCSAPLVDGRAESGPETLMRLMLRALGCDVELQVDFEGIGRVDLVVDGWLVIECDSKEFHERGTSRSRTAIATSLWRLEASDTLRLTAAQIMYRDDEVLAAVKGLLASR